MKIAIPTYADNIAPCFEAAGFFTLVSTRDNIPVSSKPIACSGKEGYFRVRLLQVHSVDVLICNGIKSLYRDMLTGSGIEVIRGVTGPAASALAEFLNGELKAESYSADEISPPCEIPRDELIAWTKDYFTSCGYRVSPGPGEDAILVDLVAEIECPLCGKLVRVAICCGAHTYRADLEIREFHHATLSGFNARVYVYPGDVAIATNCREFGIEFIDPKSASACTEIQSQQPIPALAGPVSGHEKAFRGNADGHSGKSRPDHGI
jgi:predicted Fe-Mo cluster-binding NifX family protein